MNGPFPHALSAVYLPYQHIFLVISWCCMFSFIFFHDIWDYFELVYLFERVRKWERQKQKYNQDELDWGRKKQKYSRDRCNFGKTSLSTRYSQAYQFVFTYDLSLGVNLLRRTKYLPMFESGTVGPLEKQSRKVLAQKLFWQPRPKVAAVEKQRAGKGRSSFSQRQKETLSQALAPRILVRLLFPGVFKVHQWRGRVFRGKNDVSAVLFLQRTIFPNFEWKMKAATLGTLFKDSLGLPECLLKIWGTCNRLQNANWQTWMALNHVNKYLGATFTGKSFGINTFAVTAVIIFLLLLSAFSYINAPSVGGVNNN